MQRYLAQLIMCAGKLSCFSHVQLCETLWTIAHQAPLYKGFSRQEFWSGVSCFSQRVRPDPGKEHISSHLRHWQAGSLPQVPPGKPWCFLGTQHPLWKALLSSHYPSVSLVSSFSLLIFKVPAKIFCLQLSFIQLFQTRELHLLLYSSRYLLRVFIYRPHSPELWAPQGQGKYVLHLCGSTS